MATCTRCKLPNVGFHLPLDMPASSAIMAPISKSQKPISRIESCMLHSDLDADVSGVYVLLKVACVRARVGRDQSQSSPPSQSERLGSRFVKRVKIPGVPP